MELIKFRFLLNPDDVLPVKNAAGRFELPGEYYLPCTVQIRTARRLPATSYRWKIYRINVNFFIAFRLNRKSFGDKILGEVGFGISTY